MAGASGPLNRAGGRFRPRVDRRAAVADLREEGDLRLGPGDRLGPHPVVQLDHQEQQDGDDDEGDDGVEHEADEDLGVTDLDPPVAVVRLAEDGGDDRVDHTFDERVDDLLAVQAIARPMAMVMTSPLLMKSRYSLTNALTIPPNGCCRSTRLALLRVLRVNHTASIAHRDPCIDCDILEAIDVAQRAGRGTTTRRRPPSVSTPPRATAGPTPSSAGRRRPTRTRRARSTHR